MNKYQYALDSLYAFANTFIKSIGDGKGNIHKHHKEILKELVDKSIPMTPLHKHDIKQFGVCPMCNFNVNIRNHNVACGNCGQALDWSEDENK